MWIQNPNTNKWEKQKDQLPKSNYNILREDIEDMRFYSKCLNGTSYLPINSTEDIYDILNYHSRENNDTWYINDSYSNSSYGNREINNTLIDEFSKYKEEYGMTLKNLFTPDRTIKDSLKNFLQVDVSSTDEISFLTSPKPGLVIDNIRLKEGHRVLIKDQKTYITLLNTVDPESYFIGNYYVTNEGSNKTSYFYYNEENGIYKFTNNTLIRENDLDNYSSNIRYSIHIKLGEENKQTQYHLSRLNNGYYPMISNNDPIEFTKKNNWILRNQVEYNNVLDVDFYDSLKNNSQIIGSYSIPERSVFVGDFGSIFIHQDGYLNIINSKFKYDLRSISETNEYYWIVGKEGSLLRVNKINFSIKSINIGTYNNLTSISFLNNMRGIIVGDLNEIYYTFSGGESWNKIEFEEFENFKYNKVYYKSLNNIIIMGDNGVLIELTYDGVKWVHYKRKPIMIESIDDSYGLVDGIKDFIPFDFDSSNPWNLTSSSPNVIKTEKKGILFVGDNNLIFIYDVNNFISEYDYLYLNINQNVGDIKSIQLRGHYFYIISENGHYSFDINDFNSIQPESNIINGSINIISNNIYNNIYNWNDTELQFVGNNLLLESYKFTNPSVIDNKVSNYFIDNLKSKLLFLDYDMGSKLNFFGDNQEYRLPNDVVIPLCINGPTYSELEFKSKTGERSWIDYHSDKLKQFKYGGTLDTQNQVNYNTTFRGTTSSNIITINGYSSTNDYNDIVNLLDPTFATSSSTDSLFFHDNLMVIKTNGMDYVESDIIEMNSDTINGKFMVNRVETIGSDDFLYIYSHFNESITNDIVSSTQSITFNNLNTYKDHNDFIDSFNNHYIGISYEATLGSTSSGCGDVNISPKLDAKNVYYNLEIDVIDNTFGGTHSLRYENLFLNFGYTANYNILDYLENINPIFNSNKEFYSMPKYDGIPIGDNGVHIDNIINNNSNYDDNKLKFSSNLKFEWESLWNKTFIDIEIDGSLSDVNDKLFIIDKYYDEELDEYIIELHKSIVGGNTGSTINIHSRRKLSEISSDLNELNNIQTNLKKSTQGDYSNYSKELNFKFNTDSYSKILLMDSDIKDNISGIIFTDYKNEMSLNIINLNEQRDVDISSIQVISTMNGHKAKVITNIPHKLKIGDGIIIESEDGKYNGYRIVMSIVSSTQFVINDTFTSNGGVGKFTQFIFDPYFNYIPSDIMDVGIDGKGKISVAIRPENIRQNLDKTISLINLDLTKYKFNLIDGLYIGLVAEEFPWILEAEINNATIGRNDEGIIWYKGQWDCGRWFGGTWYSGVWKSGEWYGGTWNSNKVTTNIISGKIDKNISNDKMSKWLGGNFHNGTWNSGSWYDGRWINGTWNNGLWYGGQWDMGIHNNGEFMSGIWIDGTWNNGILNCTQGESIWIDGTWNGGDFECGIWKGGKFTKKDKNIKSRFGTKSTNSRKSIWESGEWSKGEFHSIMREDSDGNPLYSLNHKYSIWKTGKWSDGIWYGGSAYNILWGNGTWVDGILLEISIMEIYNNIDNDGVFKIEGVFPFNRNDEFYVTDNLVGNYPTVGSNESPKKYLVKSIEYEEVGGTEVNTYITTYGPFTSIGNVNGDLTIVSKFKGTEWINGIWSNGIFEGSVFNGGMWIRGVFRKGEFI